MSDNGVQNNEYKYDAFISYRHCELDKFVAETLHEQLESFTLPKNVAKNIKGGKTKIERVFRDKDELPLTSNLEDPIIKALSNSEYLIVICSPRLKESIWCRKEIETFIRMHGRHKVLAVLIEGEPEDSFPDELLYVDEVVKNADGTESTIRRALEPLAADFRGETKQDIKKAMKTEILRLLAPMFNLNFDDLKQRHRERRMRRVIALASIIAIAGAAFGTYSTFTALKIHRQNIKIEQQTEKLKLAQAKILSEKAQELLDQDDRIGSIEVAYESVTSHEGVDMPWTADGQRVLSNTVGMYDARCDISAVKQIETPGVVEDFKLSPSGQLCLSLDNLNNLILWDINEAKEIARYNVGYSRSYGFINDDELYYLADGKLVKLDIATLELTEYEADSDVDAGILQAVCTVDGSSIIVRNVNYICGVDCATFEETFRITHHMDRTLMCLEVGDTANEVYAIEDSEKGKMMALSSTNGEVIFESDEPRGNVRQCCSDDDMVFVLCYDFKECVNGSTIVTAYDKKTGEKLWEKEDVSNVGDQIYYTSYNGKKLLLVIAGWQGWLLDATTGDTIQYAIMSGKGLYCYPSGDGGFVVYDSNGDYNLIHCDKKNMSLSMHAITCNGLSLLDLAAGYYLGVPKESNRIVYFGYRSNGDAQIYNGNIAEAISLGFTEDSEILAWCEAFGIDKAPFISSVLEVKEANLAFVAYQNDELEVYDLKSKELLRTYKGYYSSVLKYCGEIDGQYYIELVDRCLVFDKDGRAVNEIRFFLGLTEDRSQIVVQGKDDNLEKCNMVLPSYTFEEIVDRAKKAIDHYGSKEK